MRLVVACPVKDRAWILPFWFNALHDQDMDMEIVTLYSKSEDETLDILHEGGATVLMDSEPGRPVNDIDGHIWGLRDTYDYMSVIRNQLLNYAIEQEADVFFSLDSDILLPPGGLQTLLDVLQAKTGVVAPAVNMCVGQVVWNTMHFQPGSGNAFRSAAVPDRTSQVEVIMAAMMMDDLGMEARWHAHDQGEDLGYCRAALAKKIPLWWVPEVRCEHIMRRTTAPV